MKFFETTALAALFAVPSASFSLPSAQRVGVGVSESSIITRKLSNLDTQDQDEATSTKDTIVATFDPSDAFNEEAPYTDILLGALKDTRRGEGVGSLEVESNVDIIRDLDGSPLSKEYFAQKMGITNVESYTCPEEDAFRGLMSNACRVRLVPGGETAFYKHVLFENLDHAQEKLKNAPHKLVRDSKSYEVVASFLQSKACHTLTEKTGVCIPKCLDAQLQPDHSNPMKSKFSFLFEDFAPDDGWNQQWLLHDAEGCQAALTTFAKIHAFFWTGSSFWNDADAAKELEASVWKSGSYVGPEAQGQYQFKNVAKEWGTKRMKFEKELSSFDYWDNLGERLESMAEECGRLAHPFADDTLSEQYKKYRTFTHGDPKQANLLFRSTDSNLQVGVIDFQWAGFGLAASDIAHFLTAAVHADMLVDGGEEVLMRYYFDELQTYLVEFGAYDTADDAIQKFSYEVYSDQYEIAVLDICRLVIAYTWARFTEPVEKDDEAGCARTMNKTSYNKSIQNVVWLMTRCDEIMTSRGV